MNRLQKTLPLSTLYSIAIMITMLLLNGCTPTIQVATSDKPIEVNLNVKIEHEIKIKVDKEIEQLFDNKATF
ncbi:YnbE family lipoprotein [Photobacterium kishitanii]|uniref:YnbE family lipoprotein n=1 Tax=Photobacterium kishitanii TaxID=318456 RepID=A0A2T3KE06_9GAMM|nr:YnbE family lipoprotein [Photobacterium kishitanii]KJG10703.1 membrane protein [Photobacterium kishitanii]KJG59716.1 membrane protein [Photobacterium kishitanii]KJG63005.1 membrane protein [Photobacterium kishitanii]KJG67985.1 membrane protein [Photobacterium kishitanii]KJG71179.1 membrane protein [Photobacterium kishitanii]